jgi:hypothetical protein
MFQAMIRIAIPTAGVESLLIATMAVMLLCRKLRK